MVEFSSYDLGMENSKRPATAEFAAFLTGISDAPPTFRSLDVLREEDLVQGNTTCPPITHDPTHQARPSPNKDRSDPLI